MRTEGVRVLAWIQAMCVNIERRVIFDRGGLVYVLSLYHLSNPHNRNTAHV